MWPNALIIYAAYRQTLAKLSGKRGSPKLKLLGRVLLVTVTMPVAAPILWHALWTMPTPLAVFIGLACTHRLVRWFLRRYP
jgi:hypothetical protein